MHLCHLPIDVIKPTEPQGIGGLKSTPIATMRGVSIQLSREAIDTVIAENCIAPELAMVLGAGREDRRLRPLTDEVFSRCFSKGAATVSFAFPNILDGAVLGALHAARARQRGEPMPNVVILGRCALESLKVGTSAAGESYLFATRGMCVDDQGFVYEGEFPEPLVINCWYANGIGSVRELVAMGLSLAITNSLAVKQICLSKLSQKTFLVENSFRTPEFFPLSEVHEVETLLPWLTTLPPNAEVVVKPHNQSCGRGVTILPAFSVEVIANLAREVVVEFGGALVERRVRSAPLFAADGTREDWNLRVLVGRGGVLDMEARVGAWGGPINKAQGARIEEAQEVYTRAREVSPSLPEFRVVLETISGICVRLGSLLQDSYLGLDLIIDEEGIDFTIELNSGNIGGPRSLAAIRIGEEKFKAAAAVLQHLAGCMKRLPHSIEDAPVKWRGVELDVSNRPGFVAADLLAAFIGNGHRTVFPQGVPAKDIIRFLQDNDEEIAPGIMVALFDAVVSDLIHHGKIEEAEMWMNECPAMAVDSYEQHRLCGLAALRRNQYIPAGEAFLRYAQAAPAFDRTMAYLAITNFIGGGDLPRAHSASELLSQRAPFSDEADMAQISLHELLGPEKSPEALAAHFAGRPQSPASQYAAALALHARGKAHDALKILSAEFEPITRLTEDTPPSRRAAYQLMSLLHCAVGNSKRAIEVFLEQLPIDFDLSKLQS